MNTQLFQFILIVAIFASSCSSEQSNNAEQENEIEEITQTDTVEETSVELIDAEAVLLNVSNPDEVLIELENTLGSSEQMQAFISVDQSNELMILHVTHEGQHHLIFDQAKEVLSLDLTYLNTEEVEPPFRVSIRHKVKDYKTWKWLYDGEQKSRINAGMVLIEMGTVKGDSNDVFIIFAIPDIAKAREMMEKPNLKNKMKQGGVLGDAEIKFWRPASNS